MKIIGSENTEITYWLTKHENFGSQNKKIIGLQNMKIIGLQNMAIIGLEHGNYWLTEHCKLLANKTQTLLALTNL